MNRGARRGAGGPHPGLLPEGEGEYSPLVSEGRGGDWLERVATARKNEVQECPLGQDATPSPSGRGLG